jgi:SAM-dependent methyltransferase
MSDPTTRFSDRADDYARFRPSYPRDIVDAVVDGFTQPEVADLGAGTGISSRLLADAGARVYAIEPNASMRGEIGDPRIQPIDGTAEATTLGDASLDIVTAFQSYHWFRPDETFSEVERILRRRGRFAAVWNERDEDDAFMREYRAVIAGYMTDDTEARRGRSRATLLDVYGRRWGNVRVVERQNLAPVDWDGFVGRTRSSSYLPREGAAYDAMAAELRALYERAGDYGGARFVMLTQAYIAERQ